VLIRHVQVGVILGVRRDEAVSWELYVDDLSSVYHLRNGSNVCPSVVTIICNYAHSSIFRFFTKMIYHCKRLSSRLFPGGFTNMLVCLVLTGAKRYILITGFVSAFFLSPVRPSALVLIPMKPGSIHYQRIWQVSFFTFVNDIRLTGE